MCQLAVLPACSSQPAAARTALLPTSPATAAKKLPNPPSPPDSVDLTVRSASWDDLTGPGPVQDVPAVVDEILFEISARDMQPQTRTVTPGQRVIEDVFTVKAGAFDYSIPSYTTAAGEISFLVTKLEPGVTLDGEGFWWMGVRVIRETYIECPRPVILGAGNAWDNNPPTISPGRGFYDPGCDGYFDICYARDYASTPEPIYLPASEGSCLIGIVPPSPPKP